MSELSRRRLLSLTAATAGGVAASSLLPPSVLAAVAEPARPGGLHAIEHVVILMQENRSFDTYYGSLRGVRGFGDRSALELPNGQPVFAQPNGDKTILPFSARAAAAQANRPGSDIQYLGSLPHGWTDGQQAWAGGWNDGWIAAKSAATMAYYDRRDIPFQYELADTFTLCDAYHCSMFGPTNPNRLYLWSGNVGFEADGRRVVGNDAYDEDNHPGYTWTSYPERLERAGVSWQTYQEWDNYQDNGIEFFASFKAIARKALGGKFKSLTSFYEAVGAAEPAEREKLLAELDNGVKTLPLAERQLYRRGLRRTPPGTLASSFRADVEAGRLPKVSYLVPSAVDSEHPSASSPAASAALVYDVLDALASSPQVWARTAVFLTYDEYDGYFDHVAPPVPPRSRTEEFYEGKPLGLGFRVPMTVISPWSIGGYVSSETFDHTSVVRFLERWTGVREPNISPWRRTVSGDLLSAFDFRRPATRPALTTPAPVPAAVPRWRAQPPAVGERPRQEPGTRPSRPLPHRPTATAKVRGHELIITLRDNGARGSHFAIHRYGGDRTPPVHVDVLGTHEERLPIVGGRYRVAVHGPAGYRWWFTR
ncbi:phosphocholine-specific phospholipase C [Actinokineospora sp. NBRC 105648]|uniref:phosphocholine-specific phospholipase C n=1 Tax=Actinokineospora sp. NBRC 105648 TaxID=3032206 RepID=UPI002552FB2F|nr:phospholipase C, phosphocholine-specific [Actinokineospora sp. NBRC 105648]